MNTMENLNFMQLRFHEIFWQTTEYESTKFVKKPCENVGAQNEIETLERIGISNFFEN